MHDDADRMEGLLLAWGSWVKGDSVRQGYPTKSVLHQSWLPPQSGMTPTMAVGGTSDARERRLHKLIERWLSVRAQNTLVVVYVQRLQPADRAQRLGCSESTVRARVASAKRLLQSLMAQD